MSNAKSASAPADEATTDETPAQATPGAAVPEQPAGDPQGEDFPRAEFGDLPDAGEPEPGTDVSLDMILDVPVTLTLEVGRTRLSVRELLQLNQGSVVALDRIAGEPMDVLVNGTLVAHAEVVVVNDKFGIRFTDIVSPEQRVKRLT